MCFAAWPSTLCGGDSRAPHSEKLEGQANENQAWKGSVTLAQGKVFFHPFVNWLTAARQHLPQPSFPSEALSPDPLRGSDSPHHICSPLHVAARSNEVQMAFPTWWPPVRYNCCSLRAAAVLLQNPGSPLCPALFRFPAASARDFIKDFIKLFYPSLQTVSLSDGGGGEAKPKKPR